MIKYYSHQTRRYDLRVGKGMPESFIFKLDFSKTRQYEKAMLARSSKIYSRG